ncbi:MAG: hypothetical protein GX585_06010 [Clostridiales bacterium]|nr:hypothetical protein [Clostridiales bacterium]
MGLEFLDTFNTTEKVEQELYKELSHRLKGEQLGYAVAKASSIVQLQGHSDRLFINMLFHIFLERRDDVSDMCADYLNDRKLPEESDAEKRFAKATLPDGAEILYDTLTTTFSYKKKDGEWVDLDADYFDENK